MSATVTAAQVFEAARPPIEGRRQSAMRAANERFRVAREAQLTLWTAQRDAARDRLEAAKLATAELPEEPPEDPKAAAAWQSAREEYDAANRAMIAVEQQPSDRGSSCLSRQRHRRRGRPMQIRFGRIARLIRHLRLIANPLPLEVHMAKFSLGPSGRGSAPKAAPRSPSFSAGMNAPKATGTMVPLRPHMSPAPGVVTPNPAPKPAPGGQR